MARWIFINISTVVFIIWVHIYIKRTTWLLVLNLFNEVLLVASTKILITSICISFNFFVNNKAPIINWGILKLNIADCELRSLWVKWKIRNWTWRLLVYEVYKVYKKIWFIFKEDYFYLNQTYEKVESDEMCVIWSDESIKCLETLQLNLTIV